MTVKKVMLVAFLVVFLVFSLCSLCFATIPSTVTMPKGGSTLPDSVLYGFDLAFENVDLAIGGFFFGDGWKLNRTVDIASERLGETYEMVSQNKTEYTTSLMNKFNVRVREILTLANGSERGLMIANEASVRYMAVLNHVESLTPNQAQIGLNAAKESYVFTREELVKRGNVGPEELPVDVPDVPVIPR